MLEALLAAALTFVTNPVERRQVLDATFPSYLTGPRCPFVSGLDHAGTWTELDELQARARGWFIPKTSRRVEGSFTRPGVLETLFAIEIDECVQNGFRHYVDVIFSAAPSRASRVAVMNDWVMPSRDILAIRTRAGAVDEVQFTSGTTLTAWKHVATLVHGTWAWVP